MISVSDHVVGFSGGTLVAAPIIMACLCYVMRPSILTQMTNRDLEISSPTETCGVMGHGMRVTLGLGRACSF